MRYTSNKDMPAIAKLEHKINEDGGKLSRDHSTFRLIVFKELS